MTSAYRVPKSAEQGGEVAVPLSWDTVMGDGPDHDAWFNSLIARHPDFLREIEEKMGTALGATTGKQS